MAATITRGRRPDAPARAPRRVVAVTTALAATLGGACAGQGDERDAGLVTQGPSDAAAGADVGEFAATHDYLADVAAATDGSTYRMSMDLTMDIEAGGDSVDLDAELVTGEVDGDRSSMTVDMGELFADMADELPASEAPPDELLDMDLTMHMVVDGTTLYLRAPFFQAIGDLALASGASRSELGPLVDLVELGDGWGRIDTSEVSPSEVTSAAGAQASDPQAFLDMVSRATDVHELGTESIDGVEIHGLGATISYEDMAAAQGAGGGAAPTDEQLGGVPAMAIPIEAWVDGDDRVRRVALDLDMSEMFAGMSGDGVPGELSIGMVMHFSDYGDATIDVDVPEDTTDITDEFRDLVDQGGVDAPGSPLGAF